MRRSQISAGRLVGDVDLGLENTRVVGTVKDQARMDFPGGRIPGRSVQAIDVTGLTQNYHIGTRRRQDQRTFHYMRADATYGIERSYWSAATARQYKDDDSEDTIQGVTVGDQVEDSVTLVILDSNASHVLDFFAGGWVYVRSSSAEIQFHRIRSSTAQATTGTSVTLTLWDPLSRACAAGVSMAVFPSPYSAVASCRIPGFQSYHRVHICMPITPVAVLEYFWGQTWGPTYAVPSGVFPRANYEARLTFSYDGGVNLEQTVAANMVPQRAGYRLFDYVDDPTGALILMQLEIAP